VVGAESASQIHLASSSSKQRVNGYQSNDLKIIHKDLSQGSEGDASKLWL
jgi:hypothetical protein